jgi:glycosyltransferase EpsH
MTRKAASIIVPCYNVEKYLPRCLDSLINQTLDDIEIICINDGSPDHCIDILHDYEARYPGKIVIIDKPNEGVWRGRFDGVRIARGEYIAFLDSDDYAEPGFLASLYDTAKASDADIAVCGFSRVDMDTGEHLTEEMCRPRPPFKLSDDPGRLIEMNGAPWNKLWRAPLLKNMHDLPAPPRIMDDMLFQMLAFLNLRGSVVFVPKNLINYMIRSDSIINTISLEKLQTAYDAFVEVLRYYKQSNASAQLLQAVDAVAFEHLGVSMMFRVSCDKSINLGEQLKKCTSYLDEHFSSWRHNPYITFSYARSRGGGAFTRLNIAQKVYRAHLMQPFLWAYRFAIDRLHVDIKW